MREHIIFHNTIYNTLKKQIIEGENKNESMNYTYLLLSVDEVNIYWTIKLDYESLTYEFLNLLKFIIPSGVIILGVLFLIKNEKNEIELNFNEKIKNYYLMLNNYFDSCKNILPSYKLKDLFYSFVINKKQLEERETEILGNIRCGGKIYKFYEDLNRLDLHEHIRSVKFENLESKFKSDFILVKTFVNPLVVLSKNNFLLNGLYSNQMGILFQDLGISVINASELCENENDENLSENQQNEKNEIISTSQKKLQNFLSKTLNSTNLLNCTFLIDTQINDSTYFEETNNTFYSIYQDKKNEQILKSIKICVNCIIPIKPTLNILDISSEIINQYNFLLNELHNLNLEKTKTYSLLEFHEEDTLCLIPLSILYSYDEIYEQNEESLLNQRIYFHSILSIPDDEPKMRKFRLENKNKIYSELMEQCFNEKVNASSSSVGVSKYLKNVHLSLCYDKREKNLNMTDKIAFVKGEYYFYHTNMEKNINDKVRKFFFKIIFFKKNSKNFFTIVLGKWL
jgi:hypothetical protein